MPAFLKKGERYFIAVITGPSHVLLGLSLGPAGAVPVVIRDVPTGLAPHELLDESRLRDVVMQGVAGSETGLHPAEIVYGAGDPPDYPLFHRCAFLLAERIASGAAFPAGPDPAS